ncbi:MAG: tRNA (N6-threonylcarbamoyladenosine(37)-N6)-methyltransferase TrmO [Paraglaciecola sp.]|uniref:tRNA (N6-threonylcarbamoyladenosine(37)-N6)-methyltransferase TrmO n=1 Tax=Paraglaciecola sp. TaxID=1920173 RepID=UPI00273ED17D|nr:tRNA (N6-threonylcarbamoyladenosine(37)-N6)-methyltransferase TrmO [Paraglaciecola sp.]MDP5030006.1 tRNA (N6-threonylcarbamoyladenosine(37)-N6)-methyltransferase TrmO [Paraglaciecola sp.]MDP5130852.1 tRNA (N6-threonylcarbamoyladenosine(37)-N6)-methyltransferase TrmO [Paraglaciecola sp.]
MSLALQPIAVIRTPYKQKFAIPRQPGLAKHTEGFIEFLAEYADPNCLRGIEQFSHLWLIFQFHQTAEQGWSPMVRPPRLGGNKKLGVFATRSTFRPNNMGLSVVEFVRVEHHQGKLTLVVSGMDLLDGTPILDIKPYVPYADALPHATGGFAQSQPELVQVDFSTKAAAQLAHWQNLYPNLKATINDVLGQDPRPAYHGKSQQHKVYGMSLYDLNIQWHVIDDKCQVIDIQQNP